jgi:hypothetical protein
MVRCTLARVAVLRGRAAPGRRPHLSEAEVAMDARRRTLTSALLVAFAAWDLVLAAGALAFPDLWFRLVHGVARVDPQALLARTGALWVAFSLFHLIAWRKWRSAPYWLALAGGMRLGEIFADPTYALLASDITTLGRISLLAAGPVNLVVALFFIRGFLLESRASAPPPAVAARVAA